MLDRNNTYVRQLEKSVMRLLLSGDEPTLAALRVQYQVAEVESIEFSGVGAFVNYRVSDFAPLASPANFVLDDVELELEQLEHSPAVLLFVRDGKLSMLEFAAIVGPWPEESRIRKLGYLAARPAGPNAFTFVSIANRDAQTLRRALAQPLMPHVRPQRG
jgi:hypothetical protein